MDNKFKVGEQGEKIIIAAWGKHLSWNEAIHLAAWLSAVTDSDGVQAVARRIKKLPQYVYGKTD